MNRWHFCNYVTKKSLVWHIFLDGYWTALKYVLVIKITTDFIKTPSLSQLNVCWSQPCFNPWLTHFPHHGQVLPPVFSLLTTTIIHRRKKRKKKNKTLHSPPPPLSISISSFFSFFFFFFLFCLFVIGFSRFRLQFLLCSFCNSFTLTHGTQLLLRAWSEAKLGFPHESSSNWIQRHGRRQAHEWQRPSRVLLRRVLQGSLFSRLSRVLCFFFFFFFFYFWWVNTFFLVWWNEFLCFFLVFCVVIACGVSVGVVGMQKVKIF